MSKPRCESRVLRCKITQFFLTVQEFFEIFVEWWGICTFAETMNYRIFPPERVVARVALPASKSVSNRVLMLASLCPGLPLPAGLAQCDDVAVMRRALLQRGGVVDVQLAGTAMRFLTARFAAMPGVEVTLTGNARMCQRPIGPLVDALRGMGACITYLGTPGCPPLRIAGRQLAGGRVSMRGDVSSQFASALLMLAPAVGGITLELQGPVVSSPYISLTLGLMRQWGVHATMSGSVAVVPAGHYVPVRQPVEPDWSAAGYWIAMRHLAPGSHIELPGLDPHSPQPDSRLERLIASGAHDIDLADAPDLAPTLAVLLALLGRSFALTGLGTLRGKECDRIAALQAELAKLGYSLSSTPDTLCWDGERCEPQALPRLASHGDHRMAMALSLAALRHPGIVVCGAEAVAKSYPEYWNHLRMAGFELQAIE